MNDTYTYLVYQAAEDDGMRCSCEPLPDVLLHVTTSKRLALSYLVSRDTHIVPYKHVDSDVSDSEEDHWIFFPRDLDEIDQVFSGFPDLIMKCKADKNLKMATLRKQFNANVEKIQKE